MDFRKLLPISLFLTAAACADQEGKSATPISETNLQGMTQPISVNHGTSSGFYFDGSYLYWKADIDNLAFASDTDLVLNSSGNLSSKARIKQLDFEWNSGGQLEIGYIFNERQGWKAGLSSTHYEGHAHGSAHVSDFSPAPGHFLTPLWYFPFVGVSREASAHWNLHYNTLDLTLGRDFYVSKWLSFSPYFGLQGAWIEQKYKAKYEGGHVLLPSNFTPFNSHLKFENHFRGYGFEFGTGFIFHIIENFGIVGNIQGSLLWGYIHTSQKSSGAIPRTDGSTLFLTPEKITLVDKKHRLRTNIQTELGFIWEMFWNENRNRFHLSAMYAFNIWFNQQEFKDIGFSANQVGAVSLTPNNYPTFSSAPGDLQLQGLVLNAGFDF